jgi:hypothetical protein
MDLKSLTEEKLLRTKTGVSSDGWEHISDLSFGRVFWSYRETKNDLGECAAVSSRDDADHILAMILVNGKEVFRDVPLA